MEREPFALENSKFFAEEMISYVLSCYNVVWSVERPDNPARLREIAISTLVPLVSEGVIRVSIANWQLVRGAGLSILNYFESFPNSDRPAKIFVNLIIMVQVIIFGRDEDLYMLIFMAIVLHMCNLCVLRNQCNLISMVVFSFQYIFIYVLSGGFVARLHRLSRFLTQVELSDSTS